MHPTPCDSPCASPCVSPCVFPGSGRRQRADHSSRHSAGNRGTCTLMELLVVCAVAGIAAAQTLSTWRQMHQRWTLEAQSREVLRVLQFARRQALLRHNSLRVDWVSTADGSCLVLHTGSSASCRSCEGSRPCGTQAEVLDRTQRITAPLSLSSNTGSMVWSGQAGTVTPTATVRVAAAGLGEVHHVINILGRVRSCSPNAALGWQAC